MRRQSPQHGFSLIETMLAVGTLAIGMVFVGGTFLTGVYFTTISSERSTAVVAADEAFAKIRLYGLAASDPNLKVDEFVAYDELRTIAPEEYFYPSTEDTVSSQYSWAALCRRVNPDSHLVQVMILVTRKVGNGSKYYLRKPDPDWPALEDTPSDRPRPILIQLERDQAQLAGRNLAANELVLKDAVSSDLVDEFTFVNDGYVIIDDTTGQIYRLLKRDADEPDRVKLDRDWEGDVSGAPTERWVWVVPPPVAGGRNPLVAIYQKVLRFPD